MATRDFIGGGGRTVIEDDAVFCKNFEEEHKRLLKTLPETWDIILWGYNFEVPISYQIMPKFFKSVTFFEPTAVWQNIGLWSETCVSGHLFKGLRAIGLFCYSVSPHGAKKLLEFCFPIRPMSVELFTDNKNGGIDLPMAALYPEIEAYICIPPLVVTSADSKETSQTRYGW